MDTMTIVLCVVLSINIALILVLWAAYCRDDDGGDELEAAEKELWALFEEERRDA